MPKLLQIAQPPVPTLSQFSQDLTTSINSLDLGGFYTADDPRLLELSRRATALSMDKTATLNTPKDLAGLIKLALFDTVVYCGMPTCSTAHCSPLTLSR